MPSAFLDLSWLRICEACARAVMTVWHLHGPERKRCAPSFPSEEWQKASLGRGPRG